MKKLITLATLLQLGTANASVVAIMDSGTDITHKDLAPKVWINKKEKVGSKVDLDGSGLPGDVNGWDFTTNSPNSFDSKYTYLLTDDVKKFYVIYAKYEMKTISQDELTWLKAAVANPKLMNDVDFVGTYSHGTHVAGISAIDNPKAQIMGLKILPTVYRPYVPAPVPAAPADPSQIVAKPAQPATDLTPTKTVDQLKQELIQMASDQVNQMIPINGYLKFQKVDVVNQSFGMGFGQLLKIVNSEFISSIKRKPTQAELVDLIVTYFTVIKKVGPQMFNAAPTTLFIVAAGNDASDNDSYPDYPSSIKADNKIVVAATNGYSELAEFSNYGATQVEVAAPGVAIQSTGPAQSYLFMSGTSQAAPFVTNAVAQAKDINPALSAADIKSIILKTVDVKAWLQGKVLTSGIVNKARVIRAAELSKTMNVEVAITKAKADVADVATQKSFARRLPGMKLNYKPMRPSLVVEFPTL